MHSDPVADLLTRIRNASRARLERTQVPFSRLKAEIVRILKREGFVSDYRTLGSPGPTQMLEVNLSYDAEREPVINGIERVSRPGLRRYFDCASIPKKRGGLGAIIMTTSKGLMTDHEARTARIGGEALCAVW